MLVPNITVKHCEYRNYLQVALNLLIQEQKLLLVIFLCITFYFINVLTFSII